MSDIRPEFRFFPGAFDDRKVFEPSETPCDCCGKAAHWLYVGSVYAMTKPRLCATCIASGACGSILDRQYSFHDAHFDGTTPAYADEIEKRTPGFATFNPFSWPVYEGVPLAFLGYGEDPRFWADPAIRAAMKAYWTAETGDADLDGPTAYLLVFATLDGTRYDFALDLD